MFELIATFILIISIFNMGIILIRKIPILAELPETKTPLFPKSVFLKLKNKVKIFSSRKFSSEIILQKILSKIRILTLKTENKTSKWLEKLRQKSIKKKSNFKEDYWEKLKKE
jgi:hypothetical protein